MEFRVDVYWCLLFSGFACDMMIYSIWSDHVNLEAWTFSAFWLLNSYLVGSSPIRWDESEVVLRNVSRTARFPSLPSLSRGLCKLPHLSCTRRRQVWISLTEVWLSVFDWNLWSMSRFELQATPHSCIPWVQTSFMITPPLDPLFWKSLGIEFDHQSAERINSWLKGLS